MKKLKNLKLDKSQALFIGIFLLIVGVLVANDLSVRFGFTSVTKQKYTVTIDPQDTTFAANESVTFTSYAQTSTGQVPIHSVWTLSDSTNAKLATNCANKNKSTTCTVTSKITTPSSTPSISKKTDLTATAPESKDTITLTLTDKTKGNKEDYFIEPGPTAVTSKGAAITFISRKKDKTSSTTTEVNSQWSIKGTDSKTGTKHLLAKGPCSGSRCTVYTELFPADATANLYVQAKPDKENFTITNPVIIEDKVISPFTDTLPSWAEGEIVALASRNIIAGYDKGNFGAADPVTRGQWVLLLKRLANYFQIDFSQVDISTCSISDVAAKHYAHEAVCLGQKFDWLDIASTETKFRPDEKLKRIEAIIMIDKAILQPILKKYLTEASLNQYKTYLGKLAFSDVPKDASYMPHIVGTAFFEIIENKSTSNRLRPNDTLNRAEAATMLWRALRKFYYLQ